MILDLLKKRASVRRFSEREIDNAIIDYIIEAGRLSPSGGNEQPWKFGVITNKEKINKIARIAYNQRWIENSPLVLVLCTKIISQEAGGRFVQESRFPEWKEEIEGMNQELYGRLHLEEHQSKIPGTHMILAALEHGVFSTWVSYFEVEKINKLLELPEDYIASEVLVFGYPAGEVRVKSKKQKEEVVFYDTFK